MSCHLALTSTESKGKSTALWLYAYFSPSRFHMRLDTIESNSGRLIRTSKPSFVGTVVANIIAWKENSSFFGRYTVPGQDGASVSLANTVLPSIQVSQKRSRVPFRAGRLMWVNVDHATQSASATGFPQVSCSGPQPVVHTIRKDTVSRRLMRFTLSEER